MRTFAHYSLLLFAGSALLLSSGCSSEKKLQGHLENGERYFVAGDYEKAEIEYRNVVQLDPASAEAIARLGIIYFDQGRISMTGPYLARAHELQPENLEVRLKLGFLQLAINQRDLARDHALFVLERRPEDADAPLLLAESARTEEEVANARARLEALPASALNQAPAITALASLDLRLDRLEPAKAALDRAIAQDPTYSPAYAALSFYHRRQRNLEETGRTLQRASELSPVRSTRRTLYAQFLLQSDQVDAGRAALEALVKATPDHLPPYLMLAELAARQGKLDEGADLLSKLLNRDPGHPEALLLNGRIKLAQGKKEVAVEDMEKLARAYPGLPQAHYQLGMAYYASGDLLRATTSLRQALTLAPGYAEPLILLADLQVRQGAFDDAIAALQPLVKERPEMVQAQLILANAFRGKRDLDSALAIYRQLQAALPNNVQTHLLVGTILRMQNKRADARAAFDKAMELAPESTLALEQIVTLDVQEGQATTALQRIDARLARDPSLTSVLLLKARVLLAQKDNAGAEAVLQTAIAQAPDAAEPHEMLAQLYRISGQTDKAIASLRAASERNPNNLNILLLLASDHQQRQELELAKETYEKVLANENFEKALAAQPRFAFAFNNLAHLYAENLNDLEKAHALATRAREAMPNDPNVADTLGWVLYRQRQYPWAVNLLQESAARLPDNAEVHYHLGLAQYMTGAESAARSSLVRAMQLSPDFPGRTEAAQRLEVLSIDAASPAAAARSTLEKALSTEPSDPIALVRLAAVEEREGNAGKAIETYVKALQASPTSIPAASSLTRLYLARGENAQALEVARAFRKALPDNPDAALLTGRVALATGDYSWALSLLQEAAVSRGSDRELQFELAQAAFAMGRVEDAETALRRSLQGTGVFLQADEARELQELIALGKTPNADAAAKIDAALTANPASAPALLARAALREQAGDVAGARADYTAALARYPDFTPAKRRLVILAASETSPDPATLDLAAKAREAFPTDAELGKAYGILLYRQGTHNRAVTFLEESARQRGQDAEVWFFLGAAQHQLKRTEDSKASLERALSLNLRADLAAEARTLLGQ